MLKIIKKILFAIFAFIMTTGCVWLFPVVAQKPTTFAELVQNKEKTLEKYKDIWNDTTIRAVNAPAPEYKLGEKIGNVTIPKMEIYEMPIYYGADDINNNWQITAPGHFGNWGIFGEKTVTALGGHNYQLFYDLPKMEAGDKFIIETDFDTFIYEVTKTAIYESGKHNWKQLAFDNTEPYSLNLLTCYPIEKIVTDDMYIVYTKMTKGTKFLVDNKNNSKENKDSEPIKLSEIWQ